LRALSPHPTPPHPRSLTAQVAELWPESVKCERGTAFTLSDGTTLDSLLVVRKEKIATAFIAATQEVAARGDAIRRRVDDAEAEAQRLNTALDAM
jgi:hypothetical protein